jgi:surface antigen
LNKKPPHRVLRVGILTFFTLVALLTSPLVFAQQEPHSGDFSAQKIESELLNSYFPRVDIAEASLKIEPKEVKVTEPKEEPKLEIKIEIAYAEYIPPKPKPAPRPAQSPTGLVRHSFPYGQCTYYVATRRVVTWGGNAGTWYDNARAQGYAVGSVPRTGAIMVSFEGFAAGHVSYIERVNADGSFLISEMNNLSLGGWGIVNTRTVIPGTIYIRGYIY